LRGTEAALPGDELISVDGLGHDDRLDDPVLRDARGQRGETIGVEALARLERIGPDAGDRYVHGDGERGRPLRDQGSEAAPEALGSLGADGHEATCTS
jgi:hypothetical protein